MISTISPCTGPSANPASSAGIVEKSSFSQGRNMGISNMGIQSIIDTAESMAMRTIERTLVSTCCMNKQPPFACHTTWGIRMFPAIAGACALRGSKKRP